jgi:hypothetical protein
MDKERYAAIQAEAHRRIKARNMVAHLLEADRQAETMTDYELRAAGWWVGGTVDELMTAIALPVNGRIATKALSPE